MDTLYIKNDAYTDCYLIGQEKSLRAARDMLLQGYPYKSTYLSGIAGDTLIFSLDFLDEEKLYNLFKVMRAIDPTLKLYYLRSKRDGWTYETNDSDHEYFVEYYVDYWVDEEGSKQNDYLKNACKEHLRDFYYSERGLAYALQQVLEVYDEDIDELIEDVKDYTSEYNIHVHILRTTITDIQI